MGTQYHHMTRDERLKLEALRRAGVSVAKCAKLLGCCRQTIYNELERGECDVVRTINGIQQDTKEYSADKGQQIHDRNQEAKGRPLKIGNDRAYAEFLEKKMLGVQKNGKTDRRRRFSPAAALAAARAKGFQTSVCTTTLYSYIDKRVFLHLTNKDLWEKGRQKKQDYQKVRRIVHPTLPSITARPEHINRREELGHKEIDLIVGCKGSQAAVLTIADRKGRNAMGFRLPDKKAASVRAVFDRLERKLGKKRFRETFRSITTDNGSEFLEYDELTKSIFGGKRFEVYYCHSYSAWEKGTNENGNRMFRRFFPKGTDFGKVTQREIDEASDWINHYPRKILGWKCAADFAEL